MHIVEIPYSSYEFVVLDACIFTRDFPEDLCQYLQANQVFVADSFHSELNAYQYLVPNHQKSCFERNKRLAVDAIHKEAPFEPERYARYGLNRDIVGLIRLLAGRYANRTNTPSNCLVITSDRTLIGQIVLKNIPVDIYYLLTDQYFTSDSFDQICAEFRYPKQDMTQLQAFDYDDEDEITVYTARGAVPLMFCKRMEGSAQIYKAPESRYAKIFLADRFTKAKMAHVEELLKVGRYLQLDWVMFPTEVLYADEECTYPIGYLMPRAGNERDIKATLRTHLVAANWAKIADSDYEEYLQLARLIVRQVLYLKVYSIWPSDFNPRNFSLVCNPESEDAWKPSHCNKLYMWDTDSFFMNGYASERWHVNLLPFAPRCNSNMELCANALYQYIFYLLTLAKCPYDPDRELNDVAPFQFDTVSNKSRTQFFFIPPNLRRLLYQVLECGYEPSIAALLLELEAAWSAPENHKKMRTIYQEAEKRALSEPNFFTIPQRAASRRPVCPPAPEISVPLSILNSQADSRSTKRRKPAQEAVR